MARQVPIHARPQQGGDALSNTSRLLALVVCVTAVFALVHGFRAANSRGEAPAFSPSDESSSAPSSLSGALFPSPTPLLEMPPELMPAATAEDALPIGVVAGHWGSDTGSVCEGWLREVDINLGIAQRVVYTLRALGYEADLLEEFDPRLENYRARALVSIHADSCMFPEASGFKVARVEDSAVPALEDRLMECMVRRYRERTGLAFHEGSITPDMTRYHTFYEVDSGTPGVIIEVGFMLADRDILLHRQDLLAEGIVQGILCFLEQEAP